MGKGHKNEVITNYVHKKKNSRVIKRGGKSLRSTNVIQEVSNDDTSVNIFQTPMAPKGSHVTQIFAIQE
jgi:uncharacterized protein YabE (DUF348 family)